MRTPGRRARPSFSTAEAERSVEAGYRLNSAGSYDLAHRGLFMNEESSLSALNGAFVTLKYNMSISSVNRCFVRAVSLCQGGESAVFLVNAA